MLDTLRTLAVQAPGDDVLIAAADIAAARRRQQLQDQAQRNARQIVAQAERDAESLRRAAYRDGYLQGVLHAGADLGQALLLEQGMAARLRSDAEQVMRATVEQLLLGEEWAPAMLARWLGDQQATPNCVLHLLVPAQCKVVHEALQVRFKQHWQGALRIEYHAQERFVYRVGERVLELDIPVVSESLGTRLATQLKSLREASQQLDEAARTALTDWLQRLLASSATDSQKVNSQ